MRPNYLWCAIITCGVHDPLVDEVDLIEANPNYAIIHTPEGREATVSTRHLAPSGKQDTIIAGEEFVLDNNISMRDESTNGGSQSEELKSNPEELTMDNVRDESVKSPIKDTGTPLRRTTRVSKPPERFVP